MVTNTQRVIPDSEVNALIVLILQAWNNQYVGPNVTADTVTPSFIAPRTGCQIGFQLDTTINGDHFQLRVYVDGFYNFSQINPFRVEERINEPNGFIQVFVSISELSASQFQNLSLTNNPALSSGVDDFGIELEVSTPDNRQYIETEAGNPFVLEDYTGSSP